MYTYNKKKIMQMHLEMHLRKMIAVAVAAMKVKMRRIF
jgi:hypothetical protein